MSDHAVILLAEDREDDVVIIRRAFLQGRILNPLFVVKDGEEVISYLNGEGKYSNRPEYPLPELILLDLKMPKLDGFEVLRWIRQNPGLKALRVVVLTSSEEISDVNRAYQLGANSFLVKPVNFDHLVEVSQAIKGYWLWLSKVPETFRSEAPKQRRL